MLPMTGFDNVQNVEVSKKNYETLFCEIKISLDFCEKIEIKTASN